MLRFDRFLSILKVILFSASVIAAILYLLVNEQWLLLSSILLSPLGIIVISLLIFIVLFVTAYFV